MMTGTPQEIFAHHAEALMAGDIDGIVADYSDGIVADYSDDATFITPRGALHGKDGVRQAFTALLADLPDATWDVPTHIFEGDVLFIEWSAVAASTKALDGVDTFVFAGDNIRLQTVRYTVEATD